MINLESWRLACQASSYSTYSQTLTYFFLDEIYSRFH